MFEDGKFLEGNLRGERLEREASLGVKRSGLMGLNNAGNLPPYPDRPVISADFIDRLPSYSIWLL